MSTEIILAESLWHPSRLGELIGLVAQLSGLSNTQASAPIAPAWIAERESEDLDSWIEGAARHYGVETQHLTSLYGEVDTMLAGVSPAIFRIPTANGFGFIGALSFRRDELQIVDRSGGIRALPRQVVSDLLRRSTEQAVEPIVDRVLHAANLEGPARLRARRALLDQRLAPRGVRGAWSLGLPPSAPFRQQLLHSGIQRRIAGWIAAYALQFALWLLAWWVLGKGALSGQEDRGWLGAWVLLMVTLIPIQFLLDLRAGPIWLDVGALLKRRLLHGVTRLPSDELRSQGFGHHFGRVLDSSSVEALAFAGAMPAIVALIELFFAGCVVAAGLVPVSHLLLMVLGLAALVGLAARFYRSLQCNANARLKLTDEMVENMLGHGTRIVQELPASWHQREDSAFEAYWKSTLAMDRSGIALSLLARVYLVLALASMLPAFVAGAESIEIAISLGGTLLVFRALSRLSRATSLLAAAAVAWQKIEALFAIGATDNLPMDPQHLLSADRLPPSSDAVLHATRLGYRFEHRPEAVLSDAGLSIEEGDKVLLQGPSGGGKSTLVGLIAGLRPSQGGFLSMRGLDQATLGRQGWRRRVVLAPQFHENYVFGASFEFNLLMGRRWPAYPEDRAEALAICEELGLGPLIERMPAGLAEMVGATGWHLSHGEQSRLFIARALLQRAELVILDESFASLDPETLLRVSECVFRRVRSLIVVAHP